MQCLQAPPKILCQGTSSWGLSFPAEHPIMLLNLHPRTWESERRTARLSMMSSTFLLALSSKSICPRASLVIASAIFFQTAPCSFLFSRNRFSVSVAMHSFSRSCALKTKGKDASRNKKGSEILIQRSSLAHLDPAQCVPCLLDSNKRMVEEGKRREPLLRCDMHFCMYGYTQFPRSMHMPYNFSNDNFIHREALCGQFPL